MSPEELNKAIKKAKEHADSYDYVEAYRAIEDYLDEFSKQIDLDNKVNRVSCGYYIAEQCDCSGEYCQFTKRI